MRQDAVYLGVEVHAVESELWKSRLNPVKCECQLNIELKHLAPEIAPENRGQVVDCGNFGDVHRVGHEHRAGAFA